MNCILLVIDTLRYDRLHCNGCEWIQTPNFDRFAQQATVFDNSCCASYPTMPHRTDVITGRYDDPFHPWLPLRYDAVTLPQTLARNGYATQLLLDTPHLINGGHNFDYPFHAWHFVRGNEVDRHWIDDRSAELRLDEYPRYEWSDILTAQSMRYIRNTRERTDEEQWPSPRLFAAACRWLEDNRRRDNFFLWIDCFDPHEPWDPPAHYLELYAPDLRETGDLNIRFGWEAHYAKQLTDAELRRVQAHYAGEVTMVDHWFGRMLDKLDVLGLGDRTTVIVTSDQETNPGSHGAITRSAPPLEQVGHTVLMARVPGRAGRPAACRHSRRTRCGRTVAGHSPGTS